MDLDTLSRHQLQQLCKEHNIKANLSSKELITLLQTHLSTRTRQSHASERTRAGRTPSSNRPLSHPPVPEETPAVPTRTRESNRRSRATSRSTSTTTAAVVPEPETTTIESEKENKRVPVRRKARESQQRLGVGKPRAAGGTGPRTVTRIVPSRGSAAGGRTRARVDPVEEATRMEVVIEEPGSQPPSQSNPTSSDSSPTQSSTQPGTSQGDSYTRKISTIEAQISQLCTARDSLLSKLAVQERELVSIRDDIIVDHNKTVDDVMQQIGSRWSQRDVEAEAQRSQTLKLLDVERQRVARLEGQLETLVQRLGTLESRVAAPEPVSAPGISATSGSSAPDPNATQPGIDPAAFLDFSIESKDDFAPVLLTGIKRAAPPTEDEDTAPARAPKRARHEPHTYTTAARLEDALTHPVSPASAPAASSLPPVPAPETPRTPPMTRYARRQLALPPGSPGGPPSSHMRFVGAMPPSPTTDSPRKGMKGKGREAGTASMLLASPVKVKRAIQASKAPAVVSNASVTSPPLPPASSSRLAGASTEAPRTLTGDPAAARTRAPSTSPAFPVYEPPSRFTRRGGAGTSLGLGRPSISQPNSTASASSPAPPPGGLLPAFSLAGRQPHSGHSTDETDETNTTPGGEFISADEMLAMHQELVTPMLSAVSSVNDPWGGVPGFTSPEDGPPSPDKRTLYGTEVLPSERRGSGRVGGFPPEEDWM